MINKIFATAFCLIFASFAFGQNDESNIIPRPNFVEIRGGVCVIDRNTRIVVEHREDRHLAELLRTTLNADFGIALTIVSKAKGKPAIYISRPDDYQIVGDGYTITNDGKVINLEAATPAGRFYALQSLLQMIVKDGDKLHVKNSVITDRARFPYRGMHLDVSRHFMPVEFVKKYIDLMSQYKFNYFHWHLTDDQGWRIEIKKYPKLTEIGSKRSESHEGVYSTIFKGDGRPVEGFYTQEQIKEVVKYAKERYITVVPEIELPGHASAALAAYPQFGCKADYKYEVKKTWGIFKEVFCPTDETFKFLEDVIDETIALFPDSPYIHIGGDEVLKDHWKESAFVQELKKRENLKDEHEVQSYFVRRIEKHINKRGKKMIGWDEILEGGLAPNATVMSWRGMKGGIEAAKAKHDVIMTPTDFCYLDYGQGDPNTEPINIGGYLTLEKVYGYDPIPKELDETQAKYVLGVQGNIWTEYMKTPDKVEYMAFPRMLALAEVAWSQPTNKNFDDFTRRLNANFARLDKQNVNYRIPEPIGLRNMVLQREEMALIDLKPPISGAQIYHTIDGSTPSVKSPVYKNPFKLDIKENGQIELKTIVVLPNGRKSSVYAATYIRGELIEPATVEETKPGVAITIFTGHEGGTLREESKSISLAQFDKRTDVPRPFKLFFGAFFVAPMDGIYEFQLESTQNALFSMNSGNSKIQISSTGTRSVGSVIVPLKKGLHAFDLKYHFAGNNDSLRLRWAIRGQNWRNIGGGELVH